MTNNTFQLNRFFNLVERQAKQNPKAWLFNILIFAGFPLLLFLLNLSRIGLESGLNTRFGFFAFFIIVTAVFSSFLLFFHINHPKKGLTEVMLPASILEKYINMQLYCMVILPLSCFVLFGGMDALLHLIAPSVFPGMVIQEIFRGNVGTEGVLAVLLFLQTFFFLNLLFVKRKLLKSLGALIAVQIVQTAIMAIGIIIFDKLGYFESLKNWRGENNIHIDGSLDLFDFDPSYHPFVLMLQAFKLFILVIVPLALMIGSYFLLKNKKY